MLVRILSPAADFLRKNNLTPYSINISAIARSFNRFKYSFTVCLLKLMKEIENKLKRCIRKQSFLF
uniref:Uncharacterized protein n=1 Tax=Daphnia magna TaxID=35525 RepID=A0A0P6GVU6_9CRUS